METSNSSYLPRVESLIRRMRGFNRRLDAKLIRRALHFAEEAHRDQLRSSGVPYVEHPLEVAKILADLRMDPVTVASGLLHDVVEDTGITIEDVDREFGPEIAQLVDGVTKISELQFESLEEEQAENFRKMLFSMVRDIRVIIIKFADRLHNMRTVEFLPPRRQNLLAKETLEIYAPLAHRLGIAKIRWELEDLSLKTLDRKAYDEIAHKVALKREQREKNLRRSILPLKRELKKAHIKARVGGRAKHFYSIYQKMKAQGKTIEEIYDLLALRVVVERLEDCYGSLGVVHTLFTPIQDKFTDYIAVPKSNLYQSLHTKVIGEDGYTLEVQIRTEEMHGTAEEGIAAHWHYKEGGRTKDELDEQIVWLRHLLDWQKETPDSQEFLEDLKINLFPEEVFVFTPKGKLIKLPIGSTPIDFAFDVHTEIGLHCIAAKVSGKIVPLKTALASGDTVEILTSPGQKPSADWLKFVHTAKARSRIKRWFRDSKFEQSVKLGQEIIEKELKKLKIAPKEIEGIVTSFGFNAVVPFYAAVGSGSVSLSAVIRKILPDKDLDRAKKTPVRTRIFRGLKGKERGVRVQGLDNLMFTFAKCCQPLPGDPILGFVTRGKGITIHRHDCYNIERLMKRSRKNVPVEWDVAKDKRFNARLKIVAVDRKSLLHDITESIARLDLNILKMDLAVEDSLASGTMIVEVNNLKQLTRIMERIEKVKGMMVVERISGV
ncbi:bifunctional (p)ppGpp synthetase/guanosine-3',5'-bis(diphosphate) 3'-pyrophosphohydrolase [candidate division KSB1 bacterium]|nr:bifunctional (p)ppGpp synthetase/guanosine-3',5'-bis(diphosphate) 3'-pyrophosphohydrolase [candidate division KSB1 bacterium]